VRLLLDQQLIESVVTGLGRVVVLGVVVRALLETMTVDVGVVSIIDGTDRFETCAVTLVVPSSSSCSSVPNRTTLDSLLREREASSNSYFVNLVFSQIVISVLLEHYSKAKRTLAPIYSRALRRIKEDFQRVVHGELRSDSQRVRGDRV